jgi:heme exporter protein A
MSLLHTRGLGCVRGTRRLFAELDLALDPGQCLRVVGANGSGKTSLLRLLAGLAGPSAGEVLWRGAPLARQREAFARECLYQGHLPGLKDELSGVENLRAELALDGIAADDEAIERALVGWGLARAMHLPVRVLSAGQRRRVALARLAFSDAALWILDEPFNALDVAAVEQLAQRIDRHLRRGGLAVVTSHQSVPLQSTGVQVLELDA